MSIRTGVLVGLIVMAGLLAGIGPGSLARGRAAQAPQPDVPAVFQPFYQGVIFDDRVQAVRASLPCDRITLERTGGMVIPGGWFKLTLSKTGEATLWSDAANTFGRTGDSVGQVGLYEYGKLCHLITQVGFDRMAQRYAVSWTDMQTMTVSVSTARGVSTVTDYGGAGPVALWSVQEALQATAYTIAWKRK